MKGNFKLSEMMTASTEAELIPTKIYNRLIGAVREVLIGTKLVAIRLGPTDIPGATVDVPTSTKDALMISKGSDGAEYYESNIAASYYTMTPRLKSVDMRITRQMLEDCQFSLIERHIEEAGWQIAKLMDTDILTCIKTGADAAETGTHGIDASTALTVTKILDAVKVLNDDGYSPDYMIVSSGHKQDICNLDIFTRYDASGSRDAFTKGLIGEIFGMKVIWTPQAKIDTSYEYALIVDSRHALTLAEKRPITIEKYNEVNKGIVGIVATCRYHARYHRADACAYVKST